MLKVSYRKNPNCCLICGKWITPEVSKKRYCLECCIEFNKQIVDLERLKLNFSFVFKEIDA